MLQLQNCEDQKRKKKRKIKRSNKRIERRSRRRKKKTMKKWKKTKEKKIVAVQGMHNMRREGYTFHHLGYNLGGCVWAQLNFMK